MKYYFILLNLTLILVVARINALVDFVLNVINNKYFQRTLPFKNMGRVYLRYLREPLSEWVKFRPRAWESASRTRWNTSKTATGPR